MGVNPDEEWFRERDYDVFYDETDGLTWAHLPERAIGAFLLAVGWSGGSLGRIC